MKTNFIILLFLFATNGLVSQNKLADKFYDNYGYIKASELYEKAIQNGDDSKHNLTRLGDCFYNNSNSEKAIFWYEKAISKYELDSEHIFRYIQSLKSLGNYVKANEWTQKFIKNQNSDNRISDYSENISKYEALNTLNTSQYITIENLPINSEFSDFGTFVFNDQLIFASARGLDKTKKYGWNKEPFLDIFQVGIKETNSKLEFDETRLINASKINSDYHEATVCITNDGKTMYFTRDNVTRKNKLNFDKKGTTHLKIYKATLVEAQWENIKELSINDNVYSTGHPTLSPDNSKLYFVSDREGGFGQTDIYEVDILENNKFSKPKNLGPKINTEGREMFPFISADSTLYFSSDGRLNLGFLDIFKSDILRDSISEPQNLGAPFNSGYDDFAYFIDISNTNKRSFLSSNRPGGKGGDDIYTLYAEKCSQTIKGIVRDKTTNTPLNKASVKLIDQTGKIINEIITTENGAYEFRLDCEKSYVVKANLIAYSEDQIRFDTDETNKTEIKKDLFLESLIKENQIVINPIYFDYAKWNIRTDAQFELENIVDVLRVNPTMIIKIESHTDSRGRDKFNMRLSDKRAKSTRDYIISRGIPKERIQSAIGYGESQLLNKCSNGVRCSAQEHQVNRRSYFYIVKK